MFDVRSNDWVFMGIPAEQWKYRENRFETRKNYSKYPPGTVTHSEYEPFIRCGNCLNEFSTDSRRRNEKGEWVYVPINRLVTYQQGISQYRCLMPCMTKNDYAARDHARQKAYIDSLFNGRVK